MTVKHAVAAFLGLVAGAAPLDGQIAGKWVEQKCGLKPGHFLVNSGVLYLKKGVETRFEDERKKQLADAERVLLQALTSGGQQDNPAAWYYLGRYYAFREDAVGADSAFTRAERGRAECGEDIAFWRQQLWVPVFNAGVAAYQAGNMDSAIASFTRASAINSKDATGPFYLGVFHANSSEPDTGAVRSQCTAASGAEPADRVKARCDSMVALEARRSPIDSAIKYFKLAIQRAGTDTAFADDKRQALFNIARMHHRAERWDAARQAYHEYLTQHRGDVEATAALASVYNATGMRDSATLLYRSVLDRADSVSFLDLFQAGVAIFRGAPSFPDTTAAGARCRAGVQGTPAVKRQRCRPVVDSLTRDYQASSRAVYELAARAFAAVLDKNPYYRDALYNLANTYYQVRDTARILPVAQRLIQVDPMNRTSNLLLAQAYQMRARGDSALYYLQVSDSILPVEVNVTELTLDETKAAVGGLIANFHTKPSHPLTLTFEFMNLKGDVLAANEYAVPAIEAQGNHSFRVQVQAAGVTAYRYRPKT